MNETTQNFYLRTRALFPDLALKADREFLDYWDAPPLVEEDAYVWFAAVATALNNQMNRNAYVGEATAFFAYANSAFQAGDEAVCRCIDVSLVENLF